ncbi:hypothetical protein [Mucilaginibacter psychrotolerans]|uniref:Uncharacterized protein n=1 Tax=Mucilaginibacter psychrotolerans TaxID=1524096 RepID=A0A4Y8SI20_9SPHI|nr:hypothetical protein [Mucilaginibacter psychrotolerans]TFF38321.1 hypothetical protein E2R66_09825 [Mucilaginibacter psychrotolerans]
MKNLLLLSSMAMLPFLAIAQTDALRTDTVKTVEAYCAVMPVGKVFSSRIELEADYGKPGVAIDNRITDERGRPLNFGSVVEALNYMALKGWLFVNVYSDSHGQHYLLHRSAAR